MTASTKTDGGRLTLRLALAGLADPHAVLLLDRDGEVRTALRLSGEDLAALAAELETFIHRAGEHAPELVAAYAAAYGDEVDARRKEAQR